MIREYKKHLKKGTLRAMANDLPCNNRYEQNVTVNREQVTCSVCLTKLANFDNRKFK